MTVNCLHGLRTDCLARGGSNKRTTSAPPTHRSITHSPPATKRPTDDKQPAKESGATTHTQLESALFKDAFPTMPAEWEATRQKVVETMRMRWADSTRKARNRLYEELLEMKIQSPETPWQTTAAVMVERKNVTIQTKLTYAKNLHTVLKSLGHDATILSHYIAGLRVMGAEKPISQAAPLPKQLLLSLDCPVEVRVALLIAWKTASRLDEIARLLPESFLLIEPQEIILDFSGRTKKSRGKFHLPQNLQVITGDLTSYISENLPTALANWPTQYQLMKHLPDGYTMHSIKHGASNVLIEAAANKALDPRLVPLVLKHRTPQPFEEVTLRYLSNNLVAAARALRTGEATAHL